MTGDQRLVRMVFDAPELAWEIERWCLEAGFAVDRLGSAHKWEQSDRLPERDDAWATFVESSDLRGLMQIRRAAGRTSSAAVIAVVPACTAAWFITAFRHGATAVLSRPITEEALIQCLLHAHAGNAVMPSRVAAEIANGREADRMPAAATGLDDSDFRLLRLLCSDQTISSISRHLRMSERTLYRRLGVLRRKLGVSTRVELVREATQLGLVCERLRPGDER